MNTEIASEAIKAAPPVTVVVTAMAEGLSLNNVIGAATIIYIGLQAGYLIWKWRRDVRREKANAQSC